MKNLIAVTLVATLVGCGGKDFTSVPETSSGVEAGTDTEPEVDALPDVEPDTAVDAGPEADAPEPDALPEAALDAELDTDAEPDVMAETGPDAPVEAAPDVESDVLTEAEPDADLDATLDTTIDVAPDAEPEAGPDAEPEAGPDAEPETGCVTQFRCDGLQPQQCVNNSWENLGGVCRFSCVINTMDPTWPAQCIKQKETFEYYKMESLGVGTYTVVYVTDTDTGIDWRYSPVGYGSLDYADIHFQGTYDQVLDFCHEPGSINPQHYGWLPPTQTQLHDITTQEYPSANTRMIAWDVYLNSMAVWPIPNCIWTNDAGSAPGFHMALWGPQGQFLDTSDMATCAAWCVR